MKFVIESETDGRVGFTVLGGDGQVLATGRPCPDKGSALAAIGELMHGLGDACIEDRTEATAPPPPTDTSEIGGGDMSAIGRSGIPPV
ncbi:MULTISPECIES: YegP family protein [unclassified Micromonospora]|uniref:hypothetical protein n=1 Tax=unclassified Micromonospora TaxID=2617518 RepID=UPI0022BB1448|nr:hypothetical protein [Micromonospora sp. AKA38]GHJ16211.1 hypothetical protein TPA0908_42060 [Micromonospora sp. AKA38]